MVVFLTYLMIQCMKHYSLAKSLNIEFVISPYQLTYFKLDLSKLLSYISTSEESEISCKYLHCSQAPMPIKSIFSELTISEILLFIKHL